MGKCPPKNRWTLAIGVVSGRTTRPLGRRAEMKGMTTNWGTNAFVNVRRAGSGVDHNYSALNVT